MYTLGIYGRCSTSAETGRLICINNMFKKIEFEWVNFKVKMQVIDLYCYLKCYSFTNVFHTVS